MSAPSVAGIVAVVDGPSVSISATIAPDGVTRVTSATLDEVLCTVKR